MYNIIYYEYIDVEESNRYIYIYMYYIILLYHEFLINFAEFGQIGEGFHNSPRYNAHYRCVSK